MSTPTSFRYPFESELADQPEGVQNAHRYAFSGILDLNNAVVSLKSQINALQPSSTSSSNSTNVVETVQSTQFPGLGTVNDQTGATSYTTQTSDSGALLIVSDASAVAVTLNSVVTTPYFLFVTNLGSGTATLTPSSGTINGGSSFTLLPNYTAVLVFGGANWSGSALPVVPANTPAVTSQWLASYNSATGAFTQTQPAIADISGLSAALALLAPLASPAFTGTPTAPTAASGTDTTQVATTAFVTSAVAVETTRAETAEALLAPIAAPTFTGAVTQPDATVLSAPTTATSATSGSASALPATPAGYLEMKLGGTTFKVPYYAV